MLKVTAEDIKLFRKLDDTDKILFLFDTVFPVALPENFNVDNLSIEEIVDKSIVYNDAPNLLMMVDMAVINSPSLKDVRLVSKYLHETGCIVTRLKLSAKELKRFKRLKYCRVYSIVGQSIPIHYS
jgi:hypothetical protein